MRLLALVLMIAPFSFIYCQQATPIPDFGKVDKAELEIRECDFDKNAEALVLFDVEQVTCNLYAYSVGTKVNRHIRIKILNDKGLDQANIKLIYLKYEGNESIKNIEAQTYNLDASGQVVATKLEKKSIYDKQIDKKLSEKIFSFPEVKTGSIIEYSYTIDASLEAGLMDWHFQKDIPVKLSRYTIDFPSEIEVYSDPICILPVQKDTKFDRGRSVRSFAMTNVPALRDEPFISCKDDYLQRLVSDIVAFNTNNRRINLSSSWEEIVESLMDNEYFGEQFKKSIPGTADLDEELKKLNDPHLKMAAVYRYVRKHMAWDDYNSIFAFNGVKSAWEAKKGSSGEINLILIDLLKNAGLDAYAILVSTVDNGVINYSHPSYHQFNKVMAYLKLDKKVYVLDASDKYGSPDRIPWEVMASKGLIIEAKDTYHWSWQTLWDEKQKFKDVVVIDGSIDEQGNMSGSAFLRSYDYSREERLPELKKGKDKFIEKYLTPANSGVRIDSFVTENEEVDTLPLLQELLFHKQLSASGRYKYFSTNLFANLDKNPFTADTRFSDIFFGAGRDYTLIGNFSIPTGYSFEELPKNLRMRLPDTSVVFTRLLVAKDTQLNLSLTLQFTKPIFLVRDYDDFREFYKKLFDLLNEQVIIRKDPETSRKNSAAPVKKNNP